MTKLKEFSFSCYENRGVVGSIKARNKKHAEKLLLATLNDKGLNHEIFKECETVYSETDVCDVE